MMPKIECKSTIENGRNLSIKSLMMPKMECELVQERDLSVPKRIIDSLVEYEWVQDNVHRNVFILRNLTDSSMSNVAFKFEQKNGQRKYGPPAGWNGPPPPRGCEVFIGKLPRDIFEYELFPLFLSVGTLYEFRLMIDFSGLSRGFAFAMYTNKEDAMMAIETLDDFEIRPKKKIGVLKSVDNCKLYIGGIPTCKTNMQIYAEISKFTEGVVRVRVCPNLKDQTKNRGFAFVEYESHRSASIARRTLLSGDIKPFEKNLKVDWADPEPEIDEHCMTQVTVLYVRHIPAHINEEHLLHIFSLNQRFLVQKVKKLKNFAFVHYFSRETAQQALSQLNGNGNADVGINLDGNVIEVTWAKPIIMQKNIASQLEISKQILSQEHTVQSFSNWLMPSFFPFNNPVQQLDYICRKYEFGEPIYEISNSTAVSTSTSLVFTSEVIIPNLPLPMKNFVPNETFSSPNEAKYGAAVFALKSINFYKDGFSPYALSTMHSSSSNSCKKHQNLTSSFKLNGKQDSKNFFDLEQVSGVSSRMWEYQGGSPFPNNTNGDLPKSVLDLLATAAALANIELQASTME